MNSTITAAFHYVVIGFIKAYTLVTMKHKTRVGMKTVCFYIHIYIYIYRNNCLVVTSRVFKKLYSFTVLQVKMIFIFKDFKYQSVLGGSSVPGRFYV